MNKATHTIKILILLTALIIFPCLTYADDAPPEDYNGTLRITVDGLPAYEDYPAVDQGNLTIADEIDWDSHENSRMFTTRLSEALKSGPNFAGHYAVTYFGCGTGCQDNYVIDVTTGKIVANFTSEMGSFFKPDSRLLVTNLPDTPEDFIAPYLSQGAIISFYEMTEDRAFRKIRTLNMEGLR